MRITEKQLRRIIKEELIREGFGDVKMAEYEDEQVARQMKEIEAGNLPDNLARDLGFLIFIDQIKTAESLDATDIGSISVGEGRGQVYATYIDTFGPKLGSSLHLYGVKRVPPDLESKMDAVLTEQGHNLARDLSAGRLQSYSETWSSFKRNVRNALESGRSIDSISAV